MRISAQQKAATRQRILEVAKRLFRTQGFEQATTRDIAREVGLAAGTMFNYFPTKESIVVELAAELLAEAADDFARHRPCKASLDELLFAHLATQLRHLKPLRGFLRPVVDLVFAPVPPLSDGNAAALRAELAEQFETLFVEHGFDDVSSVQMHIFWSLYMGVVTFWSADKSPKQEDTLAFLDQSLRMYVEWLH